MFKHARFETALGTEVEVGRDVVLTLAKGGEKLAADCTDSDVVLIDALDSQGESVRVRAMRAESDWKSELRRRDGSALGESIKGIDWSGKRDDTAWKKRNDRRTAQVIAAYRASKGITTPAPEPTPAPVETPITPTVMRTAHIRMQQTGVYGETRIVSVSDKKFLALVEAEAELLDGAMSRSNGAVEFAFESVEAARQFDSAVDRACARRSLSLRIF